MDEIISFYNAFVNSINILDKKDLNLGVWNLINKLNKNPLNLKEEGYKNVYAISQLFSQLNNNKILIQINFEDLNSDIKKTIEEKFINQLILCHKCTWIDRGNTILSNNPTLSKIIIGE